MPKNEPKAATIRITCTSMFGGSTNQRSFAVLSDAHAAFELIVKALQDAAPKATP